MNFKIKITKKAHKELEKIPIENKIKIHRSIQALSENPYPVNCKKLRGRDSYRIRVGRFRIIYEIMLELNAIHVIVVRDRKNVYR